jgi:hypothetical protein
MTNITRSPHLTSAQDELLQLFQQVEPSFFISRTVTGSTAAPAPPPTQRFVDNQELL